MAIGPIPLFAQSTNVTLSARHMSRLSSVESGHKRLMKFYRFYKIDSAKQAKTVEKEYKRTLDSIWREKSKSNRLVIRLTKKSIAPIVPAFARDSLNGEIGKWWNVLHDSTSSDSVRTFAKEKTKSLILERARQYPGFQHLQEQYGIQGDSVDWKDLSRQVPGLDTLSNLFDSKPEKLFQFAEEQAVQQLSNVQGLEAVGDKLAKAEGLKDLSAQILYRWTYRLNSATNSQLGSMSVLWQATGTRSMIALSTAGMFLLLTQPLKCSPIMTSSKVSLPRRNGSLVMPVVPVEIALKSRKFLFGICYEYGLLNRLKGDLAGYRKDKYGLLIFEVGLGLDNLWVTDFLGIRLNPNL